MITDAADYTTKLFSREVIITPRRMDRNVYFSRYVSFLGDSASFNEPQNLRSEGPLCLKLVKSQKNQTPPMQALPEFLMKKTIRGRRNSISLPKSKLILGDQSSSCF